MATTITTFTNSFAAKSEIIRVMALASNIPSFTQTDFIHVHFPATDLDLPASAQHMAPFHGSAAAEIRLLTFR